MFRFSDDTREEAARILNEFAMDEARKSHPRHLDAALDAIEASIQLQFSEPTRWYWRTTFGFNGITEDKHAAEQMKLEGFMVEPLYTFPPQVD